MATDQGTVPITHNFTIVSMHDARTGTVVNKTVVHETNVHNANVSALQDQMRQLIEIQKKYQEQMNQERAAAGSGILVNGTRIPMPAVYVAGGAMLIILLYAAVEAERNDRGGRR